MVDGMAAVSSKASQSASYSEKPLKQHSPYGKAVGKGPSRRGRHPAEVEVLACHARRAALVEGRARGRLRASVRRGLDQAERTRP